ncbi:aminotransferase class V-fold PLP-dependent enzyme [Aliikangiella sp. G2MR2-5]|uniref:aminotransferase class V-fold PLP-dependent enzyme n=1 Tax=Aliikangiella sp. G2MR2-5 TaxID=2788943 RepID=UPI001AEEA97E|nr:aminotransferase class V-fold PLP-dependent enzyme [Aliikangiella sp. G2MR2-5]
MINNIFKEQDFIKDFPALSKMIDGTKVTYLDNAATTLKPVSMVNAVNEYYLGISTNVHRGKSYSLEEVSNRYEQCRYAVAELLSCSGNEVVFTRNTTEGVNLVANGLEFDEGDKILVSSDSHHSNFLPWMRQAQLLTVRTRNDGSLDLDHYYELLQLNPKLVAINHCSNVTGVYQPIEPMLRAAKEVGAITFVDAAQSIPHRRVNVTQLEVDFLTFSAHKMLGPTGIGILFGRQAMLNNLQPLNLGGGMVNWVEKDSYDLRKIPHRHEAGTPHIAGAYGLSAAIEYIQNLGLEAMESHDKSMGQHMLDLALERDYLRVINSAPNLDRGAVLSFQIPGLSELDDIARILSDSYGIICRNGHLCAQPYVDEHSEGQVLRISAYVYNSEKDVSRFFSCLDELQGVMF